jgi:putative phosphoserine phosphatase / 1-acylglycerol-3-phosphate O-acyltransferase
VPTPSPELAARLAAVHAAPADAVAVVDESALLDRSLAAAFASEALRAGRTAWRALPAEVALVAGASGDGGVDAVHRLVASWSGEDTATLDRRARALFRDEVAAYLRPEMWALVAAHHRRGHRVVITGQSTRLQLAPLADDLDADDLVATEVELRDDVATGRLTGPVLYGPDKAAAVAHTLGGRSADFAYAGSAADAEVLGAAVRPMIVGGDGAARRLAERHGWQVLPTAPRGGSLPDPTDVARTAAMYAGLLGVLTAGAGVGLARGSRRRMVDLVCGAGGDLGLALAGIDVEVTGAEHLWSARPAVFVFNHQSKIDVVLMMALLRGGFTGVAKEEAKSIPGWGQMFAVADVAFVRRGDTGQARSALEPAVAKVRDDGVSLVIAPEGTRSATPRLGRFKKGAFHIAMQAGVPMVPIVLHDAGEVMWRGAQTLRPGTVHVEVLPPVDTSGWSTATMNEHVEQVRAQFVEALAAGAAAPSAAVGR